MIMFKNVEKLTTLSSADYFRERRISNSAFSKLNLEQGGCPEIFIDYLNGEEGNFQDIDKTNYSSLNTGKILHLYMENSNDFAIANVNKPTAMMGDLCDKILEFSPYPDTWVKENIFNIAKENGLYASIKNPEVLMTSFETKGGIDYCMWVIENQNKAYALTVKEEDIILNLIESIKRNNAVKDIVYDTTMERETVLVGVTEDSFEHKVKAMLDRVAGDTIYDFKSTSGRIENFAYAVETYGYYRQEVFYRFMLAALLGTSSISNTTKFEFIVCETTYPYRVSLIKLDKKWIDKGIAELENLFSMYNSYLSNPSSFNFTLLLPYKLTVEDIAKMIQ